MSWLDDVIKRVSDDDAARPRSVQREIGWSELGGCRSALGFRLDGAWATDDTDKWAAIRGTALHAYLEPILAQPGMRTEVDTEYRGVPGHADLVDATSVTDIKGLALTTPIPTPAGWTTMGAVQVGDEVFGSDGRPCRVMAKSAVKQIGTYVVRFKDGASVVCDREHLWWAMRGQGIKGRMEVAGIEEMAASVMKYGQTNWRVPVAEPLDLPDADLPVHPYVLGCWLGDGNIGHGMITGEPPIFEQIEREGYTVTPVPTSPSQRDLKAPTRTVYGLRPGLRAAGVLNNRHIPTAYLRASIIQRQALIQGLMDSDGTWNRARKRAMFVTTSKVLAEAMLELVASVGEKPHFIWQTVSGFGVTTEVCHVEWSPTRFNPYRLPYKASQVVSSERKLARARWRTVCSIESGPHVATACIAVNSPNHTYLCGHEMVPTHNTKTLANAKTWQNDPSTMRQARVQAHGYAAGLVDAGELPEDCTVRLLVIPVDGTFADWWCYEEKFDRSLADEGIARLDDVRARMAAGEELPQDKPYQFCETYCSFFSLCRDPKTKYEGEEITDPELAGMVARYGEINAIITPLTNEKKSLASQVRGLRGTAGDWRISLGEGGEDKTVIDEAAIRADYEERGLPVPETTAPGSAPKLSVTRIKKPAKKAAA